MDGSLPDFSVHGILLARILCPPPGDLPNPGIEPASLMSPALAGGFFTASSTWEVNATLTEFFKTLLCIVISKVASIQIFKTGG